MRELSTAQARRIALAAQGFTDRRHARPTMRTLQRTLDRVGVLQVDSVNVLTRAHYMPLYSRMGPYDQRLLTRAAESRPRRLVEYWAHVQAFMPVELWPLMRHRMASVRDSSEGWFAGASVADPTGAAVLTAVHERGPVTARHLEAEFATGPRSKQNWGWNWSEARHALDRLYSGGLIAIAGRNSQFEVLYDIPERVLPPQVLTAPTPDIELAQTELIRRAARSHGVATATCLADYYRMVLPATPGRLSTIPAIEALVAAGELEPVRIAGWKRPAFLFHEAATPRRVNARALLSPFDPLVWNRERTEKLFDFHYRIEIYVPAAKRVYGYYVLPFLLGDALVARVDLKADRATGRLVVKAAFAEAEAPAHTAEELAAELSDMARWLGLDDVAVDDRGNLAAPLRAAVSAASPTVEP